MIILDKHRSLNIYFVLFTPFITPNDSRQDITLIDRESFPYIFKQNATIFPYVMSQALFVRAYIVQKVSTRHLSSSRVGPMAKKSTTTSE